MPLHFSTNVTVPQWASQPVRLVADAGPRGDHWYLGWRENSPNGVLAIELVVVFLPAAYRPY